MEKPQHDQDDEHRRTQRELPDVAEQGSGTGDFDKMSEHPPKRIRTEDDDGDELVGSQR